MSIWIRYDLLPLSKLLMIEALNPIFVRFHAFYRSRVLYLLLKCTFCWEFVPVIFAFAEVNWTSWYRMCHKMQHISKWVLGQDAVAFQNTTLNFQCQRSYYDMLFTREIKFIKAFLFNINLIKIWFMMRCELTTIYQIDKTNETKYIVCGQDIISPS